MGVAPGESTVAGSLEATVLLVEDEEQVRTALRITLEDYGMTVLSAVDGADGLKVWRDSRDTVDVVLTDVVMPRLGGPEMANSIRAEVADLPVVLMTGHAGARDPSRLEQGPEPRVLHKPLDPVSLVEALRAAIGG